jgi:hypothetical protein
MVDINHCVSVDLLIDIRKIFQYVNNGSWLGMSKPMNSPKYA